MALGSSHCFSVYQRWQCRRQCQLLEDPPHSLTWIHISSQLGRLEDSILTLPGGNWESWVFSDLLKATRQVRKAVGSRFRPASSEGLCFLLAVLLSQWIVFFSEKASNNSTERKVFLSWNHCVCLDAYFPACNFQWFKREPRVLEKKGVDVSLVSAHASL